MDSPINLGLAASAPSVKDLATADIEIDNLYKAVHNLHQGITGNPTTASADATDLATAITLLNEIKAQLIAIGIME